MRLIEQVVAACGWALAGWLGGGMVNLLADRLTHPRRLVWKWIDLRRMLRPSTRSEFLVQVCSSLTLPLLWFFPLPALAFPTAGLLFFFFTLVWVIDVARRMILLTVLAPGALLCLWAGVQRCGWVRALSGGLAALVVLLFTYALGWLYARLVTKLRRQEVDGGAFGFGDVLLGAVLGLLLGFPSIISGLLLALLIAGVANLASIFFLFLRRRYQPGITIPYAPFLILAAGILLFVQ